MSWTMVYSNDPAGKRLAGDVDTLIRAIRNGASVKVVLESNDVHTPLKTRPYVYSFEAHTMHVRNGVVFATNTLDVSCTFAGDELRFKDDSYYYMLIASTTGVLEQIRWNVGEHTMRGHDQGRWQMQWFVD
jgi:hypothetical protein